MHKMCERKSKMNKFRCDGWIRTGGAFTLGGRPKWVHCEKDAEVMLTFIQEGKKQSMPACGECVERAREYGLTIIDSRPLAASYIELSIEMEGL